MSVYYGKYAESIRRSQREAYHYRKSRHICVRCHKNKALPDRTCCAVCVEKQHSLDKNREARRMVRYNDRKEQGLCVWCGKVPPIDGQVLCETCRDKRREYRRKLYRQNKAKEQ